MQLFDPNTIPIFRRGIRIGTSMVATRIEELDKAQEFGKVNQPILSVVIAVVRHTGVGTKTRRITIFRSSLTVIASRIEELNDPKQFRKVDLAISILVGGVSRSFTFTLTHTFGLAFCYAFNYTFGLTFGLAFDIALTFATVWTFQYRRTDKDRSGF